MTKLTTIAFVAALCAAGTAHAQEINPSWYIQPSVNSLKPDAGFGVDHRGYGAGLGLGKAIDQNWDVQLGAGYARANTNGQRYQQQLLGANALYLFSRDAFRPFLLAGAGLQRDKVNLAGNLVQSENSPYLSYGLGFQASLTEQLAFQADVRKVHGFLRNDQFPGLDRNHNRYLSLGLNYAFGKPAPAPAPAPAPVVVAAPAPAPEPASAPAPVPPAPRFEKITLSSTELFAFGSAKLKSPQPKLDEIAAVLKANPSISNVAVNGYTDRIGSAKYNQKLSQQRADAVKTYLTAQGVQAERIVASGKGPANPVAACAKEKGKALIQCLEPNRRVEVEQITVERRVN